MPQIDFANPLTLYQVLWMAVIFLALYLALSRWALPQVADVIDARGARIAADLDVAREAKARADQAVAELTSATKRAHAEAQAAIMAAIAQARSEALAESRAANADLEARLAAAERQIDAARAQAVGSLREIATTTAATIVGRLTGVDADPGLLGGAVDRALASA
jgi:F-type H+-transporting ATPase subunit b